MRTTEDGQYDFLPERNGTDLAFQTRHLQVPYEFFSEKSTVIPSDCASSWSDPLP